MDTGNRESDRIARGGGSRTEGFEAECGVECEKGRVQCSGGSRPAGDAEAARRTNATRRAEAAPEADAAKVVGPTDGLESTRVRAARDGTGRGPSCVALPPPPAASTRTQAPVQPNGWPGVAPLLTAWRRADDSSEGTAPGRSLPTTVRRARRPRHGFTRALARAERWLGSLRAIAADDGLPVALAFVWRTIARSTARPPRDEGERAAERFLRLLGFRVIARNWRRAADRRDEADLILLSPARDTLVVVEVKRAAGPWDPLERIDGAKREVLWRIAGDLAERPPVAGIRRVRVDLVAVRGTGRACEVMRHEPGFLERPAKPP